MFQVFQIFHMYVVLYIDVAKVDKDVALLQLLYTCISSVCSKCFICSRRMLQMFYLDIVKVHLDIAYTCMLQAYVFSVFRCFICMFQVFHLDVAYVFNGFQMFF